VDIATPDYKRIKAEYIAGGTSYRKLAEKYDVSFSTLRKVAAKEQWTELRNKTRAKTDTKISDSISDKEADKAVNIIDVADKLLNKIADVIDLISDTQGLKHISSALKDIKDIKGFKSSADMREQEARIRNLEKQAQAEDNESNEIKVTIEGDLDIYSK
jgi:transposase-like protein